ncbi:MAG: T9SS type A sorting domain-containing protein [Bacteroidia bacterium]
MNIKKILIGLFLAILPFSSIASHLMGGEITWKCNGNGQFVFQIKLYRDCNGIPGPPSVTLNTNAPVGFIPCSLVSQNDLSPQGVGCPTCLNPLGLSSAVEEDIYESGPIFLVGIPPLTGWYFYYNDCCRNGAITNLSSSSSGDFTLRAYMFPISGQNNSPCFDSSPYFAEPPTFGICTRDSVNLSFAAFDQDMDSLVFAFAPALENIFPGNNVPYASGYSFGAPLPKTQHNPLNVPAILNTSSGQLSMTSYTPGYFVVVMEVTSYRCGAIISKIYREFQLSILSNCILSTTPTTTYNTAPDIITLPYSETITISAGDTLYYIFHATENELLPTSAGGGLQTMTLSAASNALGFGDTSMTTGCLIPPCAVLSNPTPFSYASNLFEGLSWATECQHAGFQNGCLQHTRNYHFIFTIKDNYCPVPGVSTKSLIVKVTGPTIYSAGNSLAVSFPGSTYQWYLYGAPIPGATDSLYTPTQSGTYSLLLTANNGCTLLSNSMYIGFAGIDNNHHQETKIEAFPNPSAGNNIINVLVQNLKTGQNVIRIVDISGKMVKQIPIYISTKDEHLLIDLSDLSSGVYSLNLSGEGEIHQTQLVLTN